MKFDSQEWRRWLVALGAAMLLAGYFRYLVQGELTLLAENSLIAGGVYHSGGAGAQLSAISSVSSASLPRSREVTPSLRSLVRGDSRLSQLSWATGITSDSI